MIPVFVTLTVLTSLLLYGWGDRQPVDFYPSLFFEQLSQEEISLGYVVYSLKEEIEEGIILEES